jgi:O-antigen ligase
MLGLAIATVVLLLGRRWRFAAAQAIGGAIAAVVLLVFAYVQNESWEQTPVHGVYERVVSLADPMGKRTYSDTQSFNKGDNNLFRAVWWQAVFDETVTISPWLGLGYGYDLAERFIREYYPESGEDFSTRSPHNILLTTFARTGLVGLVPYLVISALIMVRALRAARRDLETGAWWAAACVILVSACFGVVLEGPMGALVYWTVLGVANAAYHVPVAGVAFEGEATISDPHLRTVPAGDELASAP